MFAVLYWEEPDQSGHRFGPDNTTEMSKVLKEVSVSHRLGICACGGFGCGDDMACDVCCVIKCIVTFNNKPVEQKFIMNYVWPVR